jgi:hypothetical protein
MSRIQYEETFIESKYLKPYSKILQYFPKDAMDNHDSGFIEFMRSRDDIEWLYVDLEIDGHIIVDALIAVQLKEKK